MCWLFYFIANTLEKSFIQGVTYTGIVRRVNEHEMDLEYTYLFMSGQFYVLHLIMVGITIGKSSAPPVKRVQRLPIKAIRPMILDGR